MLAKFGAGRQRPTFAAHRTVAAQNVRWTVSARAQSTVDDWAASPGRNAEHHRLGRRARGQSQVCLASSRHRSSRFRGCVHRGPRRRFGAVSPAHHQKLATPSRPGFDPVLPAEPRRTLRRRDLGGHLLEAQARGSAPRATIADFGSGLRGRRTRLRWREFEPNVAISPKLFRLAALELPNQARIFDDRPDRGRAEYIYRPIPDDGPPRFFDMEAELESLEIQR